MRRLTEYINFLWIGYGIDSHTFLFIFIRNLLVILSNKLKKWQI
jgi:hypothetical protein